MNQQWQPEGSSGDDALAAVRADSASDLQDLRAADPADFGTDEFTLRRIRSRVMAEAGITASPVIPAQSLAASQPSRVTASLSRLRQGGDSSRRALLAVAAVAVAVMVGVITRPDTAQNNDDVAAAGPVVQSQLKSAETVQDEHQSLESSLSAAADAPMASSDDLSSAVSSEELRGKMAVRDSCFGDSLAEAVPCGYAMVDYGTKQASEPAPVSDEWPGAFAPLSMTVSVDKPVQTRTYVEKSRFVAEYDTSVRVSNSHDVDAEFGGPVVVEQELLVEGTWFGCDVLEADSGPWVTSLSGSQASLNRLRAGETATRTVSTRCTLDSQTNPAADVFPRTLVDVVADGALLFRVP